MEQVDQIIKAFNLDQYDGSFMVSMLERQRQRLRLRNS